MGCVNPDGTLSGSALATLEALSHTGAPEEIASKTGQPLFKVRAGLREMAEAGLVVKSGESFELTDSGRERLQTDPEP